MKNTVVYIEADGKKYPLAFNLNVMEEIQEHYGSLEEWGKVTQGDGEPKVKDLKYGVMAMLNEGIDMQNESNGTNDPLLTAKKVGRIMTDVGIQNVVSAIREITVASVRTEGESKNE